MGSVSSARLIAAGATALWLLPYGVYQWLAGELGFALSAVLLAVLAVVATVVALRCLSRYEPMLVYLALWFVLFNEHLFLVVLGHKWQVSDFLVQDYSGWLPLYQWVPMVYLLIMLWHYLRMPKEKLSA